MDSDHPEAKKKPLRCIVERIISKPALWAFLIIAGSLVTASLLLWHEDEKNSRNNADSAFAEIFETTATESPMLHFGPEDVAVTHKWSLLAGTHPAVTFRCHFDTPQRVFSRAVLCYKPSGSSVWMTEDARLRRDNTARLTLRDLRRKTSYECFFIVTGKEIIVRSPIVVFSTQ